MHPLHRDRQTPFLFRIVPTRPIGWTDADTVASQLVSALLPPSRHGWCSAETHASSAQGPTTSVNRRSFLALFSGAPVEGVLSIIVCVVLLTGVAGAVGLHRLHAREECSSSFDGTVDCRLASVVRSYDDATSSNGRSPSSSSWVHIRCKSRRR